MSGCLDGIRVLELARFQAGPRGGMLLSDLGAEVIKIEPPGGEETRKHPPLVRGQSVYFSVYNRGKKSVCLDLRNAQGKEVFAALVSKADIVLENFRPGVMRAMGFDYEQLAALNAGIILVSVSGFGQYGPYTERPAFDSLGQAMSGLMGAGLRQIARGARAEGGTTPRAGSTGPDDRRALIDKWCAERATEEICAKLHEAGIPSAPVRTIPQVAQDPHLWQREMLVKM